MRAARDTFLHYLADNLPDLNVVNTRVSQTNPNSSKPVLGAVNVKFLKDRNAVSVSKLTVSIDVLYDDELNAIDATKKVTALLQAAAYTPKLDYSDPANPKPLGSTVFWDANAIAFMQVRDALYFHYSCALILSHHLS